MTPEPLNTALKQEIGEFRPTWDFADYDCFIEYTIPDVQTVKNVMTDPEWQVAVKDQEYWVDVERALVSLGHCTPYLLRTGEVVNMAK